MRGLKSIAKRAAACTTARVAPLAWKWCRSGSLLILMYHRVLPKHSPARSNEQPGMYVSPETLDLHLYELRKHFELVQLEEWLRRARQGGVLPKLACAITFDDGWRDNHEFALPVLLKHGAPATVFLVSSFIGTSYRFWPNRLIALLKKSFVQPGVVDYPQPLRRVVDPVLLKATSGGAFAIEDADRAVEAAKAFEEQEIRELIDAAESSCGGIAETGELLNRDELADMASTRLIRYGSHTASHFRLAGRISSNDLEREIVGSRRELQDLTGQAIDLFCYPNGETSPAAIDLISRNYVGAVTTSKGWHKAGANPYLMHRIGMHEDVSDSREAFFFRIGG